jgi:sRNA-binding protein
MEMQQMMEFFRKQLRADREYFLAKMDANQAKADADRKAWREKIVADTRATQAETEAIKARTAAMREIMGTSHKEMVAEIKPGRDMETIACQEMEAP